MEAEKKAKELYDKMLQWQDNADMHIEINVTSTSAKQCSLIAVDEILKAYKHSNSLTTEVCSILLFYKEVKREIEKL
jgi:hypothetical protein